MSESKLLPCPFCGGGAVKWRVKNTKKPYIAASCLSDTCSASSWKLNIKTWNTRTPTYNPETHILIAKADVPEGLVEAVARRTAFREKNNLMKIRNDLSRDASDAQLMDIAAALVASKMKEGE